MLLVGGLSRSLFIQVKRFHHVVRQVNLFTNQNWHSMPPLFVSLTIINCHYSVTVTVTEVVTLDNLTSFDNVVEDLVAMEYTVGLHEIVSTSAAHLYLIWLHIPMGMCRGEN